MNNVATMSWKCAWKYSALLRMREHRHSYERDRAEDNSLEECNTIQYNIRLLWDDRTQLNTW